jgi:hypothetical protein
MEHREHSNEGPSVFDVRAGARCVAASRSGDTAHDWCQKSHRVRRSLCGKYAAFESNSGWSGEALTVLFVDAGSRPALAIWQTSSPRSYWTWCGVWRRSLPRTHSVRQLLPFRHPAALLSATLALMPLPAPASAAAVPAAVPLIAMSAARQATAPAAAVPSCLHRSSRRSAAIPPRRKWRPGRRIAWCAAAGTTNSGHARGLVPARFQRMYSCKSAPDPQLM